MAEYNIKIKTLVGTQNKNTKEMFLDDFICAIESFGLQFGGGSDLDTGIHTGVVDFGEIKQCELEEKLHQVQQWLLNHSSKPVILFLQKYNG